MIRPSEVFDQLAPGDRIWRWWGLATHDRWTQQPRVAAQPLTVVRVNRFTVTVRPDRPDRFDPFRPPTGEFRLPWLAVRGHWEWD